ncbi:MAG: adenosine kinase [Actinomycetota bacterium]|nr:adenosine kinase [Actinomycetota bacterium]
MVSADDDARNQLGRASVPELDVVGIGSPLVDVLASATDELVDRVGLTRGAMALVDVDRAEAVHRQMGSATAASGGSAANTVAGVAALGGRAAFLGKVADDDLGEVFTNDIRAAGVEFDPVPVPVGSGDDRLGTGRCLVLVTADGERTMATHLGVATTLGPGDVAEDLVARARIVYLEGYLWDLPPAKDALRRAADVAHDHDGSVALSLSDAACVQRHRRDFLDLLLDRVDVLFGNEQEVLELFGSPSLDQAVDAAMETGLLVAITLGERGVVVTTARGPAEVPAADAATVVDTTGAGDLFAAGFLFGLTHGADPERSARLGALCAAETVGHFGARPKEDLKALAGRAGLI